MKLDKPLHVLSCLAMLGAATNGFAASATGYIAAYRVSGEANTPPLCIRLNPPLPDKEWACLQNFSPGGEIVELLREAFIHKKVCTIYWSTVDYSGNPLFTSLECRQ